MKRTIVLSLLMVTACSKAPDASDTPNLAGQASTGVAFTYRYAFELPSRSVGTLQEAHAQACEKAGRAICRITGLGYRVDRDGQASASLSLKLAAPVARRFGRSAIDSSEEFGATLVGADISGEEVASAIAGAAAAQRTARADAAALDRSLADPRLSAAERAQIRAQRDSRITAARQSAADATDGAERLVNTPLSFEYHTGNGVGFGNAMRDSMDAALASTRVTLIAATWMLATLGPPAMVLLLLWLAWRRWGRRAWQRLEAR